MLLFERSSSQDQFSPLLSGKSVRHALPKSISLPQSGASLAQTTRSEWRDYISQRNATSSQTIVSILKQFPTPFPELLTRVRMGLKSFAPELCEDGVNGTYFLRDKSGKTIAVFKPTDEEGNSNNNPKIQSGFPNRSIPSKGIKDGEAAYREVAAYLLDREGFIGVPRTDLVQITADFRNDKKEETKIGSLQQFIDSDGSAEDFGCTGFPVRDVHKIGILDIQMLNLDRHAGNVLIKKNANTKKLELTPIDHGFSLPDSLECSWFEWMSWPQSKIPFDDETKSYIMRINIEKDAELLAKLGIRSQCIKTMMITTTLLKKAVLHNMTLFQIGSMLCRDNNNPDQPSELETLCKKCEDYVNQTQRKDQINAFGLDIHKLSVLLDKYLAKKHK